MDVSFKTKCICCTNSEYKKRLHINDSKMDLEKVKCKEIYWHLINNITHMPKAILAWENVYTSLKNK